MVGLNDFATGSVDFGASDIPYSSQQAQSTPALPYQYMPDVAGGLSFMYNLTGNDGQRINSLILDAQTIDQIFLGEITTWNSPSIAQLNPQLVGDLPNTKIVPVYRTDASGENYLLSDYLLHQDGDNFTAAQEAFKTGGSLGYGQPSAVWPTPTPGVSYSQSAYPGWAAGNPVGQNGSDNAANYVSSLSSQGAITYVETAYAKEHDFPVASLMNASGNAVQPTSLNVATALEEAILHSDLTQNLTNVYTNPLANAYPLSAYSYLVTPCSPALAAACACAATTAASTFPSQKGYALGQFVSFMACAGQEQMATLGYSPLPPNLVQDDLDAVARLTGGVPSSGEATASNCKNPYVDGQMPLPGEPAVAGQAGGGVPPSQPRPQVGARVPWAHRPGRGVGYVQCGHRADGAARKHQGSDRSADCRRGEDCRRSSGQAGGGRTEQVSAGRGAGERLEGRRGASGVPASRMDPGCRGGLCGHPAPHRLPQTSPARSASGRRPPAAPGRSGGHAMSRVPPAGEGPVASSVGPGGGYGAWPRPR